MSNSNFREIPTGERAILADLIGLICICSAPKAKGMSHCRACYYSLPPKMRKSLYNRMGEGYEQAFTESCEYLKQKAGENERD